MITRRALLVGSAALLAARPAAAQAVVQDVFFRAPSVAVLRAGIDAMFDSIGYPRISDAVLGISMGALTRLGVRFDWDLIPNLVSIPAVVTNLVIITPAVTRGFHANLRISLHEPGNAVVARAAALRSDIISFIAGMPKQIDPVPAAVQTAFGVVGKLYPTSVSGIVVINPAPNPQKQVWA